jgi:hypothetical protein
MVFNIKWARTTLQFAPETLYELPHIGSRLAAHGHAYME